jgi:hypothetical protein
VALALAASHPASAASGWPPVPVALALADSEQNCSGRVGAELRLLHIALSHCQPASECHWQTRSRTQATAQSSQSLPVAAACQWFGPARDSEAPSQPEATPGPRLQWHWRAQAHCQCQPDCHCQWQRQELVTGTGTRSRTATVAELEGRTGNRTSVIARVTVIVTTACATASALALTGTPAHWQNSAFRNPAVSQEELWNQQ